MNERVEKLAAALGNVNEKFIEESMSGIPSLNVHETQIVSEDRSKPAYVHNNGKAGKTGKEPFPVRTAIFSGIAAALIITSAIIVITKFGAGKIDVSGGQVTDTSVTTVISADTEPVMPGESDIAALKEKYPEYFQCSTFKGLEIYAEKSADGEWCFRLMSGTNRNKTEEEIRALPPASAAEMREILNWYKQNDPDEEQQYFFIMVIGENGKPADENSLYEMLGISPYDTDRIPEPADEDAGLTEPADPAMKDYVFYDPENTDLTLNGNSASPDNYILTGSLKYHGDTPLYGWYLCSHRLTADPEDNNYLYGLLYFVVTKDGKQTTEEIPVVEGAAEPYRIDTGALKDYLTEIAFIEHEGSLMELTEEPPMYNVLKAAYGDSDDAFATTFYRLYDYGTVKRFENKVDSSVTGSETAVGMKLSSGFARSVTSVQGSDLNDDMTGIMLHFDFVNNTVEACRDTDPTGEPAPEAEIIPEVTDVPYDDPVIDASETAPDDTGEAMIISDEYFPATFEIQEEMLCKHDRNPGENPPWHRMIVFNGEVYDMETVEIDAEGYFEQVKELYDDPDRLGEALDKYMSDGDLRIELLKKHAYAILDSGSCVGILDNSTFKGTHYMISSDYILATLDNGRSFWLYEKDRTGRLTNYRRIIETLWLNHNDFPEMSAVMVTDFDRKDENGWRQNYIKIIDSRENLDRIKEIIDKEAPGAEGQYRLVTPGEEKADWLPVTQTRWDGDQLYYENTEQVDMYNIAFDSGVYTGSLIYGLGAPEKIAKKLRELGAGKEADRFLNDAAQVHSNGWSFDFVTPYDSILDHVKLGQRKNIYLKITDDIIIEIFVGTDENGIPITTDDCRILVKDQQLTAVRRIVEFFRDNREMTYYDYAEDGNRYYCISGLIVSWDMTKTPGSKSPNASFTLLIDNEEWFDDIMWYTEYQLPDDLIPDKRISYTADPVDFGDMEMYMDA